MEAEADNPGVVALPPLLYGIALATGLLLHWLLPVPILPLAIAFWSGIAFLVVGAGVVLWGQRTMRRAGTNVNPSRPTTALVVSGPFRFSRNPLYVGLTLLYVGLALAINAGAVLAVLVPLLVLMQYGVIAREERYLEAKFGDVYRDYRARVRRWL